jgi:hypothetical protein
LTVVSEPDQGAYFSIVLPRSPVVESDPDLDDREEKAGNGS